MLFVCGILRVSPEMTSELMFLKPSIFYNELHKFGCQVAPNSCVGSCLIHMTSEITCSTRPGIPL